MPVIPALEWSDLQCSRYKSIDSPALCCHSWSIRLYQTAKKLWKHHKQCKLVESSPIDRAHQTKEQIYFGLNR